MENHSHLQKAPLRQKLLTQRQALSAQTALLVSQQKALYKQITQFLQEQTSKINKVAFYQPIKFEVDITPPLMQWQNAYQVTRQLALPVIVQKDKPLIFKEWFLGCPASVGLYNTVTPQTQQVIPDIVFVPTLGFNRLGYRLGYGGGFYDRTMLEYKNKNIQWVGVSWAMGQSDFLADDWDVALDAVITELGLIRF